MRAQTAEKETGDRELEPSLKKSCMVGISFYLGFCNCFFVCWEEGEILKVKENPSD